MYIKVNHGGQGSNRSVKRMISESALVGTYRTAHETVEQTLLTHSTVAHAEPDIRKTIRELRLSLSRCSPHEFTPGRKSKLCIPDMLNKGAELIHNKIAGNDTGSGESSDEIQPELEDVIGELL